MKDWQSQAHIKWDCNYHVMFLPKYRKAIFRRARRSIGKILRELCRQKNVERAEGKAMAVQRRRCIARSLLTLFAVGQHVKLTLALGQCSSLPSMISADASGRSAEYAIEGSPDEEPCCDPGRFFNDPLPKTAELARTTELS